MTRVEVDKIIDKLTDSFNLNKFDEVGVQEAYCRKLLNLDYRQMEVAVDALIETDSKYVPPISVLIKAYRDSKPNPAMIANAEYCSVCDDKGYVLMTEYRKFTDNTTIPYQYVLHCNFCPVGRAQSYNGMDCKNAECRTNYYTPPITRYFDENEIENMRESNIARKNYKLTQFEIDEIKIVFKKFSYKIPELRPFEIEHGDAWEGDEKCPF